MDGYGNYFSNAGGIAKEIDHILVITRWKILLTYKIFWSAEFFAADHRLLVATLKLHLKSRMISIYDHNVFHLEKLNENAVTVSNRFEVLDLLEDPVDLWDTFKRETLEAARGCVGWRPRSQGGLASAETLDSIEKSRAARLAGSRDQYRALSRRTRTLLRRDKER